MENNFTPEMIEVARKCTSAEELFAKAKENGIEMTEEEAAVYFAKLNALEGELSDDELDDAAGGGCGDYDTGYESTSEKLYCHRCCRMTSVMRRTRVSGGKTTIFKRCGVCGVGYRT